MNLIKTNLPEVSILEPRIFGDERGFFYESFNERRFNELTGFSAKFVQDNHSKSAKNVLREIQLLSLEQSCVLPTAQPPKQNLQLPPRAPCGGCLDGS